jgi:hypothetical protein
LYDKACDKAIECLEPDAGVKDLVSERKRWEVMLSMGARPEDDGGVLMRLQGIWVPAPHWFDAAVMQRLEAIDSEDA